MATYEDREAFIPYRKSDIVELCVEDGKLSEEDGRKFREFCEILSSYYHFEFHELLEKLKDNFAPFDPDADTKPRIEPTAEDLKNKEHNLVENLSHVLEKANYTKLSEEALAKAMEEESLITLNMDIDFDDFETWVCYHRGDGQEPVQVKKGLIRALKEKPFSMKEEIQVDVFNRVVLLLKFKEEDYFEKTKKGRKKLKEGNFTPGKTYVYLYKNIPKADLEVLFPNVEISMNMKDRLMLIGPAVAGAIPVLLKVLPSLLLIIGVIFLVAFGAEDTAKWFGMDQEKAKNVMPILVASLSAMAVLGGFGFKQYVKYKNKRIAFLKDVTDTLFFKNLDSNSGVFNMLIDAAEEEENKEVILAYYHLLTSGDLTEEALDDKIESWLEEKFNTEIDFNVDKALAKMQKLKGMVERDGQEVEVSLLTKNEEGVCHILSIDDSKTVIDYVWDNIFDYN